MDVMVKDIAGQPIDVEAVAKRMLYLAWQAAKVVGAGVMQDRPAATEDEVWSTQNPLNGGVDADYLFGRMMKIGFDYDIEMIAIIESEQRSDYQSWCTAYPTYMDLLKAAVESVKAGDAPKTTQGSDHVQAVAIMLGEVPAACTLPGSIVLAAKQRGEDPCAGCNDDRAVCGGRPKRNQATPY
jgi:hypothetical protein